MKTNWHNNIQFANKTIYWSGSDTYEAWRKHMQDPEIMQYLVKQGWDSATAISYKYNSFGFRCPEFTDQPVYIALGCSHTEGVGLPDNQTWPYFLEQLLQHPVLNLGVGGSSLDTCFRLLDYYIDQINILGVFILEPSPERFEFFMSGFPQTFMPGTLNHPSIYKLWAVEEGNAYYTLTKNRNAIKNLCDTVQTKVYSLETSLFASYRDDKPVEKARDLLHFGVNHQQYIAKKYFELWQSK